MTIPKDLRAVLLEETAAAWTKVASVLPPGAYLGGGTAIAAHLEHRTSRDLDFFVPGTFDVEALSARLRAIGRFAASHADPSTLNGVLDRAKVRFLLAKDQVQLRPTTSIAGLDVASLEDLQAMKLRAIGGGGELRDYFDLMEMERLARFDVERGLGLYVARYNPSDVRTSVARIVRALGYLGDVSDDPGLPIERGEIEAYWRRRQPQVLQAASISLHDEKWRVPLVSAGPVPDLEDLVAGVENGTATHLPSIATSAGGAGGVDEQRRAAVTDRGLPHRRPGRCRRPWTSRQPTTRD